MKVQDVMVGTPLSCRRETSLAEAAEMMWYQQCGILPILDPEKKAVGVITDRDLCFALASGHRLPADITVAEVTNGKVFACKADDDIHTALATMREKKVRRLPVLDGNGKLTGILSMDDVVLHAEPRGPGESPALTAEQVLDTLKKIYEPALPEATAKTAA